MTGSGIPCTIHPDLMATVRAGCRYLCGDCLRAERPMLFVTLPADEQAVPPADQITDRLPIA